MNLYCVGSLNVDLISYMPTFPGPGETVLGTNFLQTHGGKGANQAASAARLCDASAGECVTMVGAVGEDALGRDIVSPAGVFASSGVDLSGVTALATAPTGVAPIFVNAAGENCIVVVPGANGQLDAGHVTASLSALPTQLRAGVLVQLEVAPAATLAALTAGAAAGAPTFFTPAPAPPAGLPDAFFPPTTVLIPNEGEARLLAGASASALSLEGVALALAARGAQAVVVTRGAQGALLVCPGHATVHIPAPSVQAVVDTTGAGDCFSGALAYFYVRACAPRQAGLAHRVDYAALVEATRRAVVVAAYSVTRKGAQASYRPRQQLPPVLFEAAAADGALPTEVQ